MTTKIRASHRSRVQRAVLVCSLVLMLIIVGCQPERVDLSGATPTQSMKGYELYSWQAQGEWVFALVVGTNRIKTYDEISSPEVRVQGVAALKDLLKRLPSGEQVFWSASRVPRTALPPVEIVDTVQAYCRQNGIQLEVITSHPNTTPFPSAIPGVTPSPEVPSSPVPPVSVIPSTTTISTSPNPGWTKYISINNIFDIAFASDGTLWTISNGGLVHWDLTTETYTRYLIQARDVAVAPDGTLWLATDGGLCHFTSAVRTGNGAMCKNYTQADGLSHNHVQAVAITGDSVVWAATDTGVSRYDGGSWKSYPSLPLGATQHLAVGPNGEIWLATSAGIARYLPSQDTWMIYTQEHGLPDSQAQAIAIGPADEVWAYILWHGVYRLDGENWLPVGEIPGGIVADIAFAADGTPWVGTVGGTHYPGGALVYRDADVWTDVTTAHGLMSIRTVALGPGGAVAAGTNLGLGVYQEGEWRLLRDGPLSDQVTSVAVTPDGAAWFAFGDFSVSTPGGGLSRFNTPAARGPGDRAWGYFLGDAEVNALAVAPDGALWAGVGCDVWRFDGTDWETVGHCDKDLPTGNVSDITFTPDGAAWIANGFSLARYDGQGWTVYDKLVNSVVAAADGAVWVNGWEGLQDSFYVARFDGKNWAVYKTADSFPSAFTVAAVTRDGRVWGFAPESKLASFDGRSWENGTSWTFYPTPEGFSPVRTAAMALAPDGALWLSTDDSVARFDPLAEVHGETISEEPWTIFAGGKGLVGSFSAFAFGPDGEIWFGATRFQPAQAGQTQSKATPDFPATPTPTPYVGPTFAPPPTATPEANLACRREWQRFSSQMSQAWQLIVADVSINGLVSSDATVMGECTESTHYSNAAGWPSEWVEYCWLSFAEAEAAHSQGLRGKALLNALGITTPLQSPLLARGAPSSSNRT